MSSGEKKPLYKEGKHDRFFLDHLARYRLTTTAVLKYLTRPGEVVAGERVPKELLKDTITKRLRRQYGLVAEAPFSDGGLGDKYFHLTPAGTKHLQLPESFGEKPASKPVEWARVGSLLFCCNHENPRPRFTPEELALFFPDYFSPESKAHTLAGNTTFYLDIENPGDDEVRRLGVLVVDQPGQTNRLRERLNGEYRKLQKVLPRFFEEKRVIFSVLTSSPANQEKLRKQLHEHPLDSPQLGVRRYVNQNLFKPDATPGDTV